MSVIRKYWWWVIFLFIGIYGFHTYNETTIKKNEEKRIFELQQSEVNNRILSVIKESSANYQWINNFDLKDLSSAVLTVDLQDEWIKKGPIFFIGTIEDISEANPTEYIVSLKYSWLKPFLLNTILQLDITCDKKLIDSFRNLNKDIIGGVGLANSIAVIAKVDRIQSAKITVQSSSDKGGVESKELKIGVGRCLAIEPINEVFPTFSFIKE